MSPAVRTRAWIVPALVGGAVVAFLAILLHAPGRFMGVDDAYYLGIGANLWAGRGPTSAFGYFAQQHAPLWPLVIAAPQAWFGADAAAWAHLLVVVSGAAIIALTAWFSWRSVRLAAALAAATMLGFPFMLGLTVGMGLDLPASALVLAYLALGIAAVRRGSLRMGLAAGVLFAAAFLVKEIALPFAPVPLLVGLARRVPPARLLQVTAAIMLTGLAATSWWFALYANELGAVYRLGTPAWTLGPLAAGALVLGIAGLTASRWLPRRVAEGGRDGDTMPRLAWAGAVAWAVALTVFFSRAPTGLGGTFLNPAVVASNVREWFPSLGPCWAVGLVGGALAIAWRVRAVLRSHAAGWAAPERAGALEQPADERWLLGPGDVHAVDDLLIATMCGFPLVLEVVSAGEGPRHYLSLLGILVALGSIGWVRLADALVRRRERLTFAVAVVALLAAAAVAAPFVAATISRRLLLRLAVLAAVLAVLGVIAIRARLARRLALGPGPAAACAGVVAALAAAIVLGAVTVPTRTVSTDRARAAAVGVAADWVRHNLPLGSTVVLGVNLAFETALQLQMDYQTRQVRDEPGIRVDPVGPLGVRQGNQAGATDWVALRASPTDVTTLYGYRAATILDRFRSMGTAVWIQTEVMGMNNPTPIVAALSDATGATIVAHWTWPYQGGTMQTTIFEIDPARLAFPDRVNVTADALGRIVAGLEADPAASRAAAAALSGRAAVIPDDAAVQALVARLRALASP